MLEPHREIQALVDNFVAELSDLAKRIAIEQLKTVFDTDEPHAAASAGFTPPPRAGRVRRHHDEIEALRDKLLAVIAAQPGRRTEDINTELGTRTPQIAQPLRQLVAEHRVRTEGTRRGTRYFAVGPAELQGSRRDDEAAADEPAAAG
jgi:hypothetical protein